MIDPVAEIRILWSRRSVAKEEALRLSKHLPIYRTRGGVRLQPLRSVIWLNFVKGYGHGSSTQVWAIDGADWFA